MARWRGILVVAVLAVAARVAAFVPASSPECAHPPDSQEYDRIGWNLATYGTYTSSDDPAGPPDLTRTPVYPLFVAGCYRVGGRWPELVTWIQAGLSVVTIGFVYLAARGIAGRRAGEVAGCLLAIDPLTARYAPALMSETLFTSTLAASWACLLMHVKRPRWGWVLLAAVLAGLAVLCRPIAVLWPLAVAPVFAWVAWTTRSRRPLTQLVLFGAVVAGTVSPWVVRNWNHTGHVVLSEVGAINLYYHRAARVLAAREGIDLSEAQRRQRDRLDEVVRRENLDERGRCALMERWGVEEIRSNSLVYLQIHAEGVKRMLAPDDRPTPAFGLSGSAMWWVEAGFLLPLYAAAATGLVVGFVRGQRGRAGILLLGLTVGYFLVMSGPEAYARFRVPLMPVLSVLAGVGVAAGRSSEGARHE